MLGQYAAMSAVQGGPGFPFFANEVFKYFASGELTNLKVDDGVIPDPEIRIIVSEVTNTVVCVCVDPIKSKAINNKILLFILILHAIKAIKLFSIFNIINVVGMFKYVDRD